MSSGGGGGEAAAGVDGQAELMAQLRTFLEGVWEMFNFPELETRKFCGELKLGLQMIYRAFFDDYRGIIVCFSEIGENILISRKVLGHYLFSFIYRCGSGF